MESPDCYGKMGHGPENMAKGGESMRKKLSEGRWETRHISEKTRERERMKYVLNSYMEACNWRHFAIATPLREFK